MPYPTEPLELLGAWMGAILTIFIYSYILWKENLAFRWAEHTYIASMFSVAIVQAIRLIRTNLFVPLMEGDIRYIIPIILGLMFYTLPFRRYRWISRYTVSFLVGIGFGVSVRGALSADIVKQILASVEAPLGGAPMDWFNFLWTSLGFVLITSYFTFTKEHTGWYFYPTKIGRYILMLGLGVYFGNTVQFRMTMLGGRVQYLLQVFKIIPWP